MDHKSSVVREVALMAYCSRLLRVRVLGLLLVCCVVAGCGGGSDGGGEKGGQEEGSTLTVLAASSLTDAFGELESMFEEQNQGVDVTTSFASSSELLVQIQQGAPADVYASADERQMNTALEDGLVTEPEIFVRNRPVVIVPAENPAEIEAFGDLASVDAQIVLAEEAVPIARYTEQVLDNADAEYGGGFAQAVRDKIVSREANVRASANRVALGEADATFVYISDVTEDISEQVRVIEIPENLNVVATYPIATIEESLNAGLAREWVDLVLSDEGQSVLESYNFERVG
jgi:molybdate transport system substrate-binding protein